MNKVQGFFFSLLLPRRKYVTYFKGCVLEIHSISAKLVVPLLLIILIIQPLLLLRADFRVFVSAGIILMKNQNVYSATT